jgi:hypothetical protein
LWWVVGAQAMVAEMLADDDFVTRYIAVNSARLAASYAIVTQRMDKLNLPYFKTTVRLSTVRAAEKQQRCFLGS